MSFVVENISNEIVSDYNAGIAYRDSDSRVCMLLWSDNPKEFSQEIQVICREDSKDSEGGHAVERFYRNRILCGKAGRTAEIL